MSLMMMLAMSGSGLKTVTFTGNALWLAPDGITNLALVSGKGGLGTSDHTTPIGYGIFYVNFRTDTSTGSGSFDWSAARSYAEGVLADMNADGAATWTEYHLDVWPDGTNAYSSQPTVSGSSNIPGSFSLSGPSSGPASFSDQISMDGSMLVSGTTGPSAGAFGLTFPGGPANATTVPITEFTDVAITPGTYYAIAVPTGGSITISYYG